MSNANCCPTCGGDMRVRLGIAYDVEARRLKTSTYDVTFTKSQGAIFELLWARRTQGIVTRGAIMDRLYGDRADGGAYAKVVDVFVCKIRRKLAAVNADLEVITVYDVGYALRSKT